MAKPKRPEPLAPEVERAAEAGDVAAMRQVGKHLYESGSNGPSEKWLLAAAEAGDAEAMYTLTRVHHDRAGRNAFPHSKAQAASWCKRAAEAGWVPAIWRMHTVGTDPDERAFWLRKAAQTGDPWAPTTLAGLLDEMGRASEAEDWHRRAANEPGDMGRIGRNSLADFLLRQGRLEEAAKCWRQDAEAGDPAGAWHLAYVLEKLGRPEEAASWRQQGDALQAANRAQNPERPEASA